MDEEKAKSLVEDILKKIEENQNKQQTKNNDEPVIRCIVVDMSDIRAKKQKRMLTKGELKMIRDVIPLDKKISLGDIVDELEFFSDIDNLIQFMQDTNYPGYDDLKNDIKGELGEAMTMTGIIYMYSMLMRLKHKAK